MFFKSIFEQQYTTSQDVRDLLPAWLLRWSHKPRIAPEYWANVPHASKGGACGEGSTHTPHVHRSQSVSQEMLSQPPAGHSTGPRGEPRRFGCHKSRTAHTASNKSVRFFLNHFGTSSAISSSKSSGSLLGMFSICFMLILIKEFETEQTVDSRWLHKCEISKLFYLPQKSACKFLQISLSL